MAASTTSVTRGTETPVALFAYRRPDRLERTLRCLRDAGARRIYAFSDGPADEGARADVERVRELLAAVDWADLELAAGERNLGLSVSIRAGLDRVFSLHEAAVIVEDDIHVAPEFLAYAGAALAHYSGDPRVAGITGLRLPFDRDPLDQRPYDVFYSPRFSSWGWATWRGRWQEFVFDPHELRRRMAGATGFRPWLAGIDMPAMIYDAVVTERLGGSWDVVCAANMLLAGTGFITPAWNMIENGGLEDGTHGSGPSKLSLAWEPEHAPRVEALRFCPARPDARVMRAFRGGFTASAGGALARVRAEPAARLASRRLRLAASLAS